MAAYLVTHAAQTHAHELAVGRASDRLSERGLAYAGRTNEAQNRCLQTIDSLLHGQILDDALLDLLQPIVVRVQHFDRVGEILVDLALLLPWKSEQRVDVVAHDRSLGRHG